MKKTDNKSIECASKLIYDDERKPFSESMKKYYLLKEEFKTEENAIKGKEPLESDVVIAYLELTTLCHHFVIPSDSIYYKPVRVRSES